MTKNVKINGLFYETGITILATISRGSEVGGININKIAYLIIKVKLTPIELAYLDRKVKRFLAEITQETDTEALIPEKYIERIAYLYIEEITLHLIKILRIISGEKSEQIEDFVRLINSNAILNKKQYYSIQNIYLTFNNEL